MSDLGSAELIELGLGLVVAVVGNFWRAHVARKEAKHEAFELVEDIVGELYQEKVKLMWKENKSEKLTDSQKGLLRSELTSRLRIMELSKPVRKVVSNWSIRRLHKLIKKAVKKAKS